MIDSLFGDLANARDAAHLPPASRCAGRAGSLMRLCEGLIAARRSELGTNSSAALEAEPLFRRTVEEKPNWSVAWYGLGIARLQLERFKVLAKEGPLQGLGTSLVAGAGNALVRALELDSTMLGAAEALAQAPMPREGVSRVTQRLTMLRRIRTSLPLSPASRLGIGRLEREAGVADSAVVMLDEALAHGADSGIVYLELARVLYKAGRTIEGHNALITGASAATTNAAKRRYRDELSWVASPEELVQWDSVPVPKRSAWLDVFWSKRDVREGRPDGSRLIEHYKRVEYAMKNFKIEVPQVGRQKFVTISAAGDRMTDGSNPNSSEGQDAAEITDTDYGPVTGDVPFRQFSVLQDLIDDRGTMWIRHGKPDVQLNTTGGLAIEAWEYTHPGEAPIVLFFKEADFDGTSGASVLVPTIAGRDGIAMEQICGKLMDICPRLQVGSTVGTTASTSGPIRAGAGARGVMANGSTLRPEQLQNERIDGKEYIARASTSDAFPQVFAKPLDPIAQIYGLQRADNGASRLLIAFAIPGDKLSYAFPPAAGGRPVYAMRVQVMSADKESGKRYELDTLRQFVTPQPLLAGQYLTGLVELPVPPASYAASLLLTQEEGKGAVARLGAVQVPGGGARLQISDVVLGREGSGVKWNSGTSQIPLNPLNAYPKGGLAELYYQLGGLKPGQPYQTRLEFFPQGEEQKPPKLAFGFTDQAGQPTAEVARTVQMDKLDPGVYRVRVTIKQAASEAGASAWLVVSKKP